MQDAAKFWNGMAKKYAASPVRDTNAYEYTLERTRTYLSPTDQVLELGCGTGTTALKLAPFVEHIVASDFSAGMIEIANRKLDDNGPENVEFVTADIYGNGLISKHFDVVLAFNVIHLLEDTESAIREMHDRIKPGGFLITKTVCKPGSGTPLKFRMLKLMIPVMQWFGKAPFVKFMEIPELEKAIESCGFRIIETGNYPAAPPNHFVVAQKL